MTTSTDVTTSTVRFDLVSFEFDGLDGVALLAGPWQFTPTRRLTSSTRVVAPARITVEPTAADLAAGYFILDLPSTDTGEYGTTPWAWTIREPRPGTTTTKFIPTSTTVLEYAGLVSIDPLTLDPIAQPTSAWMAALDQTNAAVAALTAGEVTHAQLQAVTDEVAQIDNAVGELAGQTLSRLNAKVDTTTYSAFQNLALATLTSQQAEITTLQTQVTTLQTLVASLSGQVAGGTDGGVVGVDFTTATVTDGGVLS